jgi:hypothetical protein
MQVTPWCAKCSFKQARQVRLCACADREEAACS